MAPASFEFTIPSRIVVGVDTSARLPEIAGGLGTKALLVCGHRSLESSGFLERLEQGLRSAGVDTLNGRLDGEPDIDTVDELARQGREGRCDLVLGAGGGSVLDAAKAVAGLLANDGGARRYMELVGDGEPFGRPAMPMIAMPTTAGTGSEVTRNAVLACPERRIKASMRSAHLLPRAVIVDPRLSVGLPVRLTASTGLDALTQLLESCASRRATGLTTALALEGIELVGRCLGRATENGTDLEAREGMAQAALLSGITLAHAGLGAAHGIAGPLGGRIPVAHGTACARLLPPVLETNLRALKDRDQTNAPLDRLAAGCARLLGRESGPAEEVVPAASQWVRELCDSAGIPGLRSYGLAEDDLEALAQASLQASSMKTNPVTLTGEDVIAIIRAAMAP